MLKSLVGATLVAATLSLPALAAEPTPPAAGPVVLDDRQLDQVSAGDAGISPIDVFFFAHNVFAANSGGLPWPAQKAIWLLHKPIVAADN